MPIVPINVMAVIASAIASMIVGTIWYGPLFGKQWIKMMKFSAQDMAAAKKKGMGGTYAMQFVASLVMAFVLAHSIVFASTYMKVTGLNAGVMAGFWNWIGFVAPVTLGMSLWGGKSWKLWLLDNGHYLVTLCIMGAILAMWP